MRLKGPPSKGHSWGSEEHTYHRDVDRNLVAGLLWEQVPNGPGGSNPLIPIFPSSSISERED